MVKKIDVGGPCGLSAGFVGALLSPADVLSAAALLSCRKTGKGILHLSGAQISMQTLDLEAGEAKLTGRFDGLEYTAARTAGSFWHRLLR